MKKPNPKKWHCIAGPYDEDEEWMLDNVKDDMDRGKCTYIVRFREVYRAVKECVFINCGNNENDSD